MQVMLIGQMNAGKSTLINALLHKNLLPTDGARCTKRITIIRYGAEKSVRLITGLRQDTCKRREAGAAPFALDQCSCAVCSVEDDWTRKLRGHTIQDFSLGSADLFSGLLTSSSMRPDPLAKLMSARSDHKEAKQQVVDEMLGVEIALPEELLRCGFTLVDSPGLNDREALDRLVKLHLGGGKHRGIDVRQARAHAAQTTTSRLEPPRTSSNL